jgi:hypothetical protein
MLEKILLITSPDKVRNNNKSVLLLYPGADIKLHIQNDILPNYSHGLNVYLHEDETKNSSNIEWLLDISYMCDIIFIDIDNCPDFFIGMIGHFMGMSKTCWRSQLENQIYSHINDNRVFDLSMLLTLNGE